MNNWFTIDKADKNTYIISEYRHWEETHCYLLNGSQRSLLIDTGLGIGNISEAAAKLTDKPVTAVATHIHWDHIGGHKYYPDFYAHEAELDWLDGGECIRLGDRVIEVIHTPGHSPGHMCFWEEKTGYLFTGDLAYRGMLTAWFPSTDPEAYLKSLETVAALPVKKVFPAHHALDMCPEMIIRMRNAFVQLKEKGMLYHGSGTFDYGDWSVWL